MTNQGIPSDTQPDVQALSPLEAESTAVDGQALPPPKAGSRRSVLVVLVLLVAVLAGAATYLGTLYLTAEDRNDDLASQVRVAHEERQSALTALEGVQSELNAINQEREVLYEDRTELVTQVQRGNTTIARLERAQSRLEALLEEEIAEGEVVVRGGDGALTVDLTNRILFPPGGTELGDRGQAVLRRAAESLVELDSHLIRVEGHTDSTPISRSLKAQFPSNWELSTARATNVVRFLEDECGLPGRRLVAAGFSKHRPVASNRRRRGRRRNRRIQLTLQPLPAPPE